MAHTRSVRWWTSEQGVKSLKVGVVSAVIGVASLVLAWQTRPRADEPMDGNITTVASVTSNITWALTAAPDGSLYYSDSNQLRQVLSDGRNRLVTEIPAPTSFIRDIAIAPDGTLYLTDDTGSVRRYANGSLTTVAGSQTAAEQLDDPPPSLLRTPRGVSVAGDGTLYIVDMLNDRIVARTTGGDFVRVGGFVDMPNDMATDANGRPFVTDRTGRVFEITANNSLNQVFDISSTRGRVEQESTSPVGLSVSIAFTPDNDLIVADQPRAAVYRVRDGLAERLFGGTGTQSSPDGARASDASLTGVAGVAVTTDNILVVSEHGRLRGAHLA